MAEEISYPYEEIVAHLNQITGKVFKHKSEITRKHIKARMKEGFTVEDFKQVHVTKWEEWKGTEFEKFVCPTTLYRPSNFERYLMQGQPKKTQDFSEYGCP